MKDFVAQQAKHCSALQNLMERNWRKKSIAWFIDHIQKTYNIFETKLKRFEASKLYRILKFFQFVMTDQLRDQAQRTLRTLVVNMAAFLLLPSAGTDHLAPPTK